MKVSIIIKSFNRPHYLDRCLTSIYKYVEGFDEVVVVDDGTPQKYLDQILTKFSNIKLIKSDQYNLKSEAIVNHQFDNGKLNGFTIPTNKWIEAVKTAHDYVLVTEDDVWFTSKIDLSEIAISMQNNAIQLTKLGWLGNSSDVNVEDLSPEIHGIKLPKIFTGSQWMMDLYIFNKYKFFSLLCRLNLADNHSKRVYWQLNSILMGMYHKDYWLFMWKDSTNKLDEKIQLRNAAIYYHKHKNQKFFIGRTKNEVMKTTFKSTASGVYHDYEGIDLDINRVNSILNQAWLKGEFDSMQNFPNDFSDEYIAQFLNKENHPNVQFESWSKWSEKFKQQYRNLGAQVD